MKRTLEFTLTVNNCLGCHFCPQDKLNAAYKGGATRMTIQNFAKIVAKVPLDCSTDFSGMSESLLNPDAGHMMKAAFESGHRVHWFSTLVNFTEEQARPIRAVSFAHIRIHVPDATEFKYSAGRWLENFARFVKMDKPFTMMSMGPEIDPRIVEAVKHTGVEIELPTMLSRAGNLWGTTKKTGKIICAMDRWSQNVIFPDGTVVLCCHDYSMTQKLGNLLTEDYQAIEERALALRDAAHSPEICLSCEWSQQA